LGINWDYIGNIVGLYWEWGQEFTVENSLGMKLGMRLLGDSKNNCTIKTKSITEKLKIKISKLKNR